MFFLLHDALAAHYEQVVQKPHLILHFDINRTLIATDRASN